MTGQGRVAVRVLASAALGDEEPEVRRLLERSFADSPEGDLEEEDWQHALGGDHFLLDLDGQLVGHAAVVERRLEIGGRPLRAGYVEAVAIAPEHQRRGLGSTLMRAVSRHVIQRFELGALGTGSHGFYESLGWRTWQGPTSVRTPAGALDRTPDEDGYVMVLLTLASPPLQLTEPISCDWRPGGGW